MAGLANHMRDCAILVPLILSHVNSCLVDAVVAATSVIAVVAVAVAVIIVVVVVAAAAAAAVVAFPAAFGGNGRWWRWQWGCRERVQAGCRLPAGSSARVGKQRRRKVWTYNLDLQWR